MTFPLPDLALSVPPAGQGPLERPASSERTEGRPADARLTPRERQIVRLVAWGCSNGEIAERLALRPQTVKNRLSEIYDKTRTRNRVELAVWGIAPAHGRSAD